MKLLTFKKTKKSAQPIATAPAEAPRVVTCSGAISRLPSVLGEMGAASAFVFADKNTYRVAGDRACRLLEEAGVRVRSYVFPEERLDPNESAVGLAMMNFEPAADVIVGVGSGVINDICKIVARTSSKPYIVVATAPSMDGYASATSSMSVGGLKTSLPSKCPDVIIGDSDILRQAPMRMMLSGFGDMLAKYVALCEWRISATINGEAFSPEVADMVRKSLARCIQNVDALLLRDEQAVEAVFEGLVLSGLAMKLAGSSRPASGIEHYLSHIWDMRAEEFGAPSDFHGIQCAVGTYLSVKLYERLVSIAPNRERALAYVAGFDSDAWNRELRAFLGKGAEAMITLDKKEKKYDREKHAARIEIILEKWSEILSVIKEELPTLAALDELYDRVGLPKSMEDIGLDSAMLDMTFRAAKDIRDKYVLPRLCFDLGVLDDMLLEPESRL